MRRGVLPVITLVVVIAWALFAVIMLTGTLVSAQQIDNRVKVINTVLPPINRNLQSIPLALETGRIAGQINDAARPIGPQFTQVVGDVDKINGSVQSVLGFVGQINGSVKMINSSVQMIRDSVVPIGAKVAAINGDVKSINDSARGINDKFDDILDRSRSIDDGAKGINERAMRTRDIAQDIKDDLKRLVDPLLPDINRNARAIARSPLLDPTDLSRLNPLLAGLHLPKLVPPHLPVAVPPLPVKAPVLDHPLETVTKPKALGLPGPLGDDSGSDKSRSSGDRDSVVGGLLGN